MKSVTRLFTQFQPETYDVTFRIDEDAMRFSGSVTIHGKKVGRPSERITLHQNGLKVTSATITKHDKKGNQVLAVERINNQNSLNEVRLHTEAKVFPGEYTITAEFEAEITKGMTGIYPCFFKDGETEKTLFATQFESHHAREAFPCIDEPEAKAVFNMTLVTRTGVEVLGNTPIKEQRRVSSSELRVADSKETETRDSRLETRFEATPRMSSYLLAFVVGELHSKSAKTKNGVDVNIWATTAQPAASLEFAVDVAKRCIEFFEDYFGLPYPLAKADHVALPDFSSGAMENWGLITYRERVLLAYPGETSQSTLEQIALVIAHETSHQWFGNLVTMQWWDDLWLNESFANMMENDPRDQMFPEWHVWDSFIASDGLSALRRDSVAGVQAVRTDVHHPDEISSLFDPSIVYAKGSRLLYMLRTYIGEEAFRAGLTAYFKKHAYGNTRGSDLWAALSEASGKDIGAFMNPWLERPGFPVVRVTQTDDSLTITQEHFLDDPAKADKTRVWPVPLFSDSAAVPETLQKPAYHARVKRADYITINRGVRGHYIVDYTEAAHKKALLPLITDGTLSAPERLMILNDASMLSRAGYQRYGDVLGLLDAYKTEASEPVWDIMGLVTGESRRFIDQDPSLEDRIKRFTGRLVTTQYERLGWDGTPDESAADQKLRALIIGLGAYAENPDVLAEAKRLFEDFRANNTPLPPELRAIVMLLPVKQGDRTAFDFLVNLHDTTPNSDLKSDACDALTATRNPAWASELLARLKDAKLVKPQDADRWLVYLLRNRFTRDTAWQWMVDNWQWLEDTYKSDKSYDYLPRYAASCVNTREYQQKFKDLFESKVGQVLLKRNITIGFEEIENRVSWLERDLASVQAFFREQ
jgi:aminopeptidase N